MSISRNVLRGALLTALLFAASALLLVAFQRIGRSAPPPRPETHSNVLAESREIEGIPCQRLARFSPEGKLVECVLARETEFGSLRLPAGTTVHFDSDLRPTWTFLPGDTLIEGHLWAGEGHGFMTSFHPNGRLSFGNLREPEVVQKIPCNRGAFGPRSQAAEAA